MIPATAQHQQVDHEPDETVEAGRPPIRCGEKRQTPIAAMSAARQMWRRRTIRRGYCDC